MGWKSLDIRLRRKGIWWRPFLPRLGKNKSSELRISSKLPFLPRFGTNGSWLLPSANKYSSRRESRLDKLCSIPSFPSTTARLSSSRSSISLRPRGGINSWPGESQEILTSSTPDNTYGRRTRQLNYHNHWMPQRRSPVAPQCSQAPQRRVPPRSGRTSWGSSLAGSRGFPRSGVSWESEFNSWLVTMGFIQPLSLRRHNFSASVLFWNYANKHSPVDVERTPIALSTIVVEESNQVGPQNVLHLFGCCVNLVLVFVFGLSEISAKLTH